MRKAITPFVFCFLLWLTVTWSRDPWSLVVGVVLCGLIAAAVRSLEPEDAPLLLVPDRLFWSLAYVPVLFIYVVQANLDVAYRVLHPGLPIRPGRPRPRRSGRSNQRSVRPGHRPRRPEIEPGHPNRSEYFLIPIVFPG